MQGVPRKKYSCKFPGCNNCYYSNVSKPFVNKHFYKFPSNEYYYKLWKKACGLDDSVRAINYFVCGDHFIDSAYVNQENSRLNPGAIPGASTYSFQRVVSLTKSPFEGQAKESALSTDGELCLPSRLENTEAIEMGNGWTCAVYGCQLAKDSTGHCFPNPDNNPKLFLLWIRLMGNSNLINKEANVIFKTNRICSKHFVPQDFLPNGSLKEFVYPTLHLPVSGLDQLSTTPMSDLLPKASLGDTFFNLPVENEEISSSTPAEIVIYDVSNILPLNVSAGSTDEIYEDSSIFQLVDDPETLNDSVDTPVLHLFSNQRIESSNILPHQSDHNSNKGINQNELDETGNYIVNHRNEDHLYLKVNERVECQESQRPSKIISNDSTNFLQEDNIDIKEVETSGQKTYFKSLKNFSQEHNCVTDLCRICFTSLIDTDDAIKLYEESSKHDITEIKNMLKLVLPDLEMELYSNTVICLSCYELLLHSYELKAKWLLTEQKLQRIIEKEQSQIKRDGKLIIIEQKEKTESMDNETLADHYYTNKIVNEDSNKMNLEEIVGKILTLEGGKAGNELHIYHDDVLNELPTNISKKGVSRVWGPGPYLCEICGATYENLNTIRAHLFRHSHPRKKYKARQRECICEVCGKLFRREYALRMHSRKHKNHNASHNVYNCSLCNKVLTQKWRLNYHIQCKHTKTFYQCHICGKRLSSKSWTQHIMRHNPLKKIHSCHICDKKFYYRVNLKKHISSHVKERLLKCEYCGKNLKYESSLQKHIAIFHLGEAQFVCEFCNKVYWKKLDLKKHYMRIHGRSFDTSEANKEQVPSADIQGALQNSKMRL